MTITQGIPPVCMIFEWGNPCRLRVFKLYNTANRSLYRNVVCNVPVSCKANGVGNQLGAWRYSDLKVITYKQLTFIVDFALRTNKKLGIIYFNAN